MADRLKELQDLLQESSRRNDRKTSEELIVAIEKLKSAGSQKQEPELMPTGKNTSEGRPIYKDKRGNYVTEKTVTVSFPDEAGNEVIVNAPTVYEGRIVPEADALDRVIKSGGRDPVTGRDLERFRDMNTAVEAAKQRSAALGQEVEQMFNPAAQLAQKPEGSLYDATAKALGVGGQAVEKVQDLAFRRVDAIKQLAKDQLLSGKMQSSPWSHTLLVGAGHIAAIPLDVLGAGVGALAEKAAQEHPVIAKAILGGLRSAAEFEREHINLSGAIKQLRKDHPDQMAEIDALANILFMTAPVKARTSPGEFFAKTYEGTRGKFVTELLTDRTTKKARLKLAKGAKQEGKEIILKYNDYEKQVVETVKKIPEVKPQKSLIQNKEAIELENYKTIQNINSMVNDVGGVYDKGLLNNSIDMATNDALRATLKSSPMTPLIADLNAQAKAAVKKHPNTVAGLWEARKEFDAVVKANRPTTFEGGPTTYNTAARKIRQEMNDLMAFYAGSRPFRRELEKSSHLYDALDTLHQKIQPLLKDASEDVVKKLTHAHAIFSKYGALKTIGATSTGAGMAVAAMYYHQPLLAAAIATGTGLYTATKATKAILSSPQSTEFLGQALQLVEKAMLVSKDKPHIIKQLRADRAAILELYEASKE